MPFLIKQNLRKFIEVLEVYLGAGAVDFSSKPLLRKIMLYLDYTYT